MNERKYEKQLIEDLSPTLDMNNDEDDDSDDEYEDSSISWTNLIFLPFNPIFEAIVMSAVILKSILGPITAVLPFLYCPSIMDDYIGLTIIKYYYKYLCTPIFIADLILHVLHRQLATEARRREHFPKSEICLLLDFIAWIPFYQMLVVADPDTCPAFRFWPNLVAFTEFLVVYRIVEYFSLVTTHSTVNLILGSAILAFVILNALTCIHLMFTNMGYCSECLNRIHDWRLTIKYKLNETNVQYATYVYAMTFVVSFVGHELIDDMRASTLTESCFVIFLLVFGYIVVILLVTPKLMCEAMLHLRRIIEYKPKVHRIITEVQRRNLNNRGANVVDSFYALVWAKRSGISHIPEVIMQLPRYIRLDISLDLFWQVFYHSPTFRNTSISFKRLLCDYIRMDYKLPGERFFVGPQAQTNLYYIKSGIVQLISVDDGTTSLLSMTSGTVFGDISFIVPPIGRSVVVRCVTYCEVFYISRANILSSLSKFPADRRDVMRLAHARIEHAHILNGHKEQVRGVDRAEDEDIYWIKKRWWELSNTIDAWKAKASATGPTACELPIDEMPYHCAKYIGQLVLCNEAQLQRKSMFAKFTFPWILVPNSLFNVFWHKIVMITVYLVLVLYPPNICRREPFPWFHVVLFRSDFVYCLDLAVLLCTATLELEAGQKITFSDVLFARFKTFSFLLDVLSTIWIESLFLLIGMKQYYWIAMYNRLLKIKILFISEVKPKLNWKLNIILPLALKICLVLFCHCYIGGFLFALIERHTISLTTKYWMGHKVCPKNVTNKYDCNPEISDVMYMSFAWLFNIIFTDYSPKSLTDIYFSIAIISITNILLLICQSTLMGAMYLMHKDTVEYQFFVTNLKQYYKIYKIHPDLLIRLDAYLVAHWKYFKGMDVMKPNILKNEPFDIYWHAHAEVAAKIIGNCGAFQGADSAMIRELAYKSKFLLRPKNTTVAVFGVQTKNIIWLSQGWITCEFHDQEGEIRKKLMGAGVLIAPTSVFLGTPSYRTYTAYTECETLFIERTDFFSILRRYPTEWVIVNNAIKEFGPLMGKNHALVITQHADYEVKLRERVFRARMDIYSEEDEEEDDDEKGGFGSIFDLLFHNPESQFIRAWCLVRAVTAFVMVINASLVGVTGTLITGAADIIVGICTFILVLDICIKFTIGYYTKDGILVQDLKMCALHYASRTLFLDVLGCIQIHRILFALDISVLTYEQTIILNTLTKLISQMYVVIGYMNFLADMPSSLSVYLKLIKWQLVLTMFRFTASQFFFSLCFLIAREPDTGMVTMRTNKYSCWLPKRFHVNETPTVEQQLLVLAESFIFTECGMLRLNLGFFNVTRQQKADWFVLAFLGIVFWYVTAYTICMLCLCRRTSANFRYGVTQLRQFLQAERVEDKIVDKVLAHFKYIWRRTDGINLEGLMQERIGVVFRRDLSYFFYSRTLHALNTLLKGDENMLRKMSAILVGEIFMKGEDIIRQDDLNDLVFIVNRGKVGVSIDGEEVAVLTKGSIFGLMDGIKARPARMTAYAIDHTDVMQTPAKDFEYEVDDTTLEYIRSAYPTLNQDYIAVRRPVVEDPRNTIPYLLRGKKILLLPCMKEPVDAQKSNSWYRVWLTVMWVIAPVMTACIVMIINTMPTTVKWSTVRFLFFFDFLHILYLIVEFFTLKVVIVEDKCVYRRFGFNLFRDWTTHISIFSLLAPLLTFVTGNWIWQCTRVVRLRLLYNFHQHFCKTFRTSLLPAIMKMIYVFLILHALIIGWMSVACSSWDNDYKYLNPQYYTISAAINNTIDYGEWTTPSFREGHGCKRLTMPHMDEQQNNTLAYGFLVAKRWQLDYLVALNYIILIYTQTDWDVVVPNTTAQAVFNCFLMLIIYLVSVWVISLAISYMYMNIRQLYNFDYCIQSLVLYLEHAGLSSMILESVVAYTNQLWKRQSGNWLPALGLQTSICLREDIMGALYMHHLQGPALLQHLPPYFLRQLVTKLQRIVIFPGKCVVKQNDIYPCMYFIHEGEVEKWQRDPKTGESRLISYLFTCGYFGVLPGLFPKVPHPFTYVTRTVTDFVVLMFKDWKDLRDGYPEITEQFYAHARLVKNRERL